MALSRRTDRKDRKPEEEPSLPAQNGSSVDVHRHRSVDRTPCSRWSRAPASAISLPRARSNRRWPPNHPQEPISVSPRQHARSSTSTTSFPLRADLFGMAVADLRQTTPIRRSGLIPDSMAREQFVIPMSSTTWASMWRWRISRRPSSLASRTRRAARPSAPCWRPSQKSAVPSRTTIEPSAGSTTWSRPSKRSREPEGDPPGHDDPHAGRRGRRCPGRPGRRAHPHPGDA